MNTHISPPGVYATGTGIRLGPVSRRKTNVVSRIGPTRQKMFGSNQSVSSSATTTLSVRSGLNSFPNDVILGNRTATREIDDNIRLFLSNFGRRETFSVLFKTLDFNGPFEKNRSGYFRSRDRFGRRIGLPDVFKTASRSGPVRF